MRKAAGDTRGPQFKKKGRDDSFPRSCYANTLDGSISVGFNRIKPRIGWVKTYEVLPDDVSPLSVTISRASGRWFLKLTSRKRISNY
ncbi:MAG: hypothetical protein F6K39_25145 [Okeania sp. SIO3B3]|nr:hypothetical protein [Okeania sp. SIO3B3]